MKILFIAVSAVALFSCAGSPSSQTTSSGDSTSVMAESEQEALKTNWVYSESINELDDSKIKTARIEANEELEFEFPYSGGTKVWIVIHKQGAKTNLMLSIAKNKGQFIPGAMGDRYITARFDDKPAEKYYYTDPSDFSAETIFINNAKQFMNNLKDAKTTLVQCEFFNEGNRNIKFDTGGLEW